MQTVSTTTIGGIKFLQDTWGIVSELNKRRKVSEKVK